MVHHIQPVLELVSYREIRKQLRGKQDFFKLLHIAEKLVAKEKK